MSFADVILDALFGHKPTYRPQPGERWKEVGSGDQFAPAPSEVVILAVKGEYVQFAAGKRDVDSELIDTFVRFFEPVRPRSTSSH